MILTSKVVLFAAALLAALPLNAQAALSRPGNTVGTVVSTRGDERIRFVGMETWQPLTPGQLLMAGDEIRTGPAGGAAVLFEDDTQIRVHRNSIFEVDQVRGADGSSQSRFKLLRGAAWSRARQLLRGLSRVVNSNREVVQMATPVATIGIRGTDWHVQVQDSGETLVTVLTGEVALFNPLGEVSLTRGEQGQAVAGSAPTKRVLVDVRDRPLFALEFEPRWFEVMTISDTANMNELIQRQTALKQVPESARTTRNTLELARAALDRNDVAEAARLLALERSSAPKEGPLSAEQELLEGMRLARSGHRGVARAAFEAAAGSLQGRDQAMVQIGLAGLDLLDSRYPQSVARLDELAQRAPEIPDVAFYRAIQPFYAGEYELALERVAAAENRFPADARFAGLASIFHIVHGDDRAARAAFERALVLDPRNALALMARGAYFHEIAPDAIRAEQSLRASAEAVDTAEAWNNLALVYDDLGRDAAGPAFQRALNVDPDSALTLTNYASYLLLHDRIEEAKVLLDRVRALKPGYSQSLLLAGLIELFEGRPAQGVEQLKQASVADPSLLQIYTGLAFAHYQSGEFAEAGEALAQARRVDPDDPLPLSAGAIIALDQFEAGQAIRYSREALDRIRTVGSFAVENLASASSGLSSLGFAYVNLGMDDWGEFYAQRAFSPYNASDHFLLAQQYESNRARTGELAQGLLLDPFAISFPNRYYEPVRAPRTDLSFGASGGDEDGAGTDNVFGTLQGFARLPLPVAYSLSASRSNEDGFRTNTRQRTESVQLGVGTRFNDQKDQLLWVLNFDRGITGTPGDASDPDPDDANRFNSGSGSLGWQHRFDYDNRLIARIGASSMHSRINNAQPFGRGLDDLTYSLLVNFGEDAVREVAEQGLFDASELFGSADEPVLLTNSDENQTFCLLVPAACASPLRLTLPDRLDPSPLEQGDVRTRQLDLQLRHLLSLGQDFEFSYGAEWTPQDQDQRLRVLQASLPGSGLVFTDIVNGLGSTFTLGRPETNITESDDHLEGGQAYVQGRWKLTEDFSTESGVFLRHSNDDEDDRSSWDPRIGLTWEPRRGHWLRAAFQREMGVPAPFAGSLAPVAVAGLAITDLLPLNAGKTVRDSQLRWDAEWLPGLYTVVQAEHQDIDAYSQFFEFTNQGLSIGGGRAQQVAVGSNLWFLERFGAFVRYTRTWSENTSDNTAADGKDLPLLADDALSLGLTWVHPREIRISGGARYSGKRWGDAENTVELDDFITTSLSANWQPFRRHWSFTLAAENLFDERFDLAPGVPAPGVAVSLTAEYRLSLHSVHRKNEQK